MSNLCKVTEVNGVPVVGEGVGFERIRRITGYLVGTLDRFNNGKRARRFLLLCLRVCRQHLRLNDRTAHRRHHR